MERWDIYDSQRQLTGKTICKDGTLHDGEFHLVVHVCLFNSNNELLIQQRHRNKRRWPGLWDLSAAGAALTGEKAWQAAERETFEEIGLQIDLSSERPYITVHFDDGFDDFFLLQNDVEIEELIPSTSEVEKIEWASKEKIQDMMRNGLFNHYHEGFIELLFSMNERNRGSLID